MITFDGNAVFGGFDNYQLEAMKTAIYPNMGNNIYYPALGLGEAGEVQGKIKKIMRDNYGIISQETKEAIAAELGDLLWYIAMLAYELDLPLSSIAANNIEKLKSRAERNVLQGSGDNR